jgi:hypothetical protein
MKIGGSLFCLGQEHSAHANGETGAITFVQRFDSTLGCFGAGHKRRKPDLHRHAAGAGAAGCRSPDRVPVRAPSYPTRRLPRAHLAGTCSRRPTRPPSTRRQLPEPERRSGRPRPRDRGRLGGQPQRLEERDEGRALLTLRQDPSPASARTREHVLQEHSLHQGGPVDAGTLRAYDAASEPRAGAAAPVRGQLRPILKEPGVRILV